MILRWGERGDAALAKPKTKKLNADIIKAGLYTLTNIYSVNLFYKNPWKGTCPSELNLILAKKNSSSSWTTYSSSTVDTFRNIISASSLTSFSFLTGSDATVPLPVKLMDFTGSRTLNDALLKWTTASEINSNVFEIERSFDGNNFIITGSVNASENSTTPLSYHFNDKDVFINNTSDMFYYRLKMVDLGGSFIYSNILSIKTDNQINEEKVTIYPNPFSDELLADITIPVNENVSIILSDLQGRVLYSKTELYNSGTSVVNLKSFTALQPGFYFITIMTSTNNQVIKLFKK